MGTYFCWFTHFSGKLPRVAKLIHGVLSDFRWNCKVHVKQQVIGAVRWNFCIRWKWKRFHPTYGVSIRQCEVVKKKSGKKPSCCLTCLESLIWKTLAKGKKDGMCGHHTIRDTHKHKHTNTPWLVGNKSPKRKKVVSSFFFIFRQSWISIHLMAECQKLGPRDLGSTPMSPLIRPPKKVWHCWLVVP